MVNERCWLTTNKDICSVYVNFAPYASYHVDDKVNKRFITATLARARVATKIELSQAFGYHRNYITRLENDLAENGAVGMVNGKRGPKDSWKVTAQARKRIIGLLKKGKPVSQIMKTIEKELGIKLSDVTIYRLKKISSVSRASEVQELPAPSQMSLEFPEEEPQAPQYESRGETSYAGAFLFYPALIAMGILPLFQRIYRRIWGRLYGLDETLLSFI